jgi:hypothetical protein
MDDEYASDDDDLIENDDASALLARVDPGRKCGATMGGEADA